MSDRTFLVLLTCAAAAIFLLFTYATTGATRKKVGAKVQPHQPGVLDKYGKRWPECVPPDPNDPYGEMNNNLTVNDTAYKCSAEGRWVVDHAAQEWKAQRQRERSQLLSALTSRKLTHDELMQLEPLMNTREWQPYFAAVKYAEMYDILLVQWELQTETKLPFKTPLSRALGEYNRAPQEDDNRRAVESLIAALQALPHPETKATP